MFKIKKYFIKKANFRRGYSLLEMLITLLIVNIIILMVSQILAISLKLSIQAHERSIAREELTNIVNLIKRDVRNAKSIKNCTLENCEILREVEVIKWSRCENTSICREVTTKTGSNVTYRSNEKVLLHQDNGIIFEEIDRIGDIDTPDQQKSILLTLKADHKYETLGIKNLYRQVIVSTRNFDI